MRIDLNAGIAASHGSQESGRAHLPANKATPDNAQARDATQVAWSHAGAQALTAAALRSPEIRQEEVAALSLKIQQGKYQVSAEQVADAVLSHMESKPAA